MVTDIPEIETSDDMMDLKFNYSYRKNFHNSLPGRMNKFSLGRVVFHQLVDGDRQPT